MKSLAFLVLAAVLASPALAQDADHAEPSEPRNGIHITGNWTLDVREADGTLVESRAFHNDLSRNGANFLINLFTKRNRLATLVLEIGTTTTTGKPCTNDEGEEVNCLIIEAEDPLFGDPETSELTITKLTESDGSPIVLARFTGTISADRDAQITRVNSLRGSCLYNVSEPCTAATRSNLASGSDSYGSFTFRTLDTPLSVAAGQSVDVVFELSFDY
ncbi:MAG: hypothetical protein AAF791_15185 [Bacteroidota bacterium]